MSALLGVVASSGRVIPWLPKLDGSAVVALRGDLGVTSVSGDMSDWASQLAGVLTSAAQATAARRPHYVGEKFRGRKAPYLFSTDQHWLRGAFSAPVGAPAWWAWVVFRNMQPGNQACIAGDGTGAGTSLQTNNSSWPKLVRANAGVNLDRGTILQNQIHSVCLIQNGASPNDLVVIDGVQAGAGGTFGNNAWAGLTIGASGTTSIFWSGMIAEIVIGTGAPSVATVLGWHTNYAVPFYRMGNPTKPYYYLMPAGDSLTVGFGSTNSDGWRRPHLFDLQKQSLIGSHWLSCVGSKNEGNYSEDKHEATSGSNIFDLNAALNTAVVGKLITQPTDVLTVQIGGEDCANQGGAAHTDPYVPYDGSPTCTVGIWTTMIQSCASHMAAGRPIVVMNQIAINPAQVTENANRLDFNAGQLIEVANMQGSGLNIIPCDVRGALGAFDAAHYFDQRHPNDIGYELEWAGSNASPPSGWKPNIRAALIAAGLTLP